MDQDECQRRQVFVSRILKSTKAYSLINLETMKIIKSPNVMFFEDKRHLENCPNRSIDEPSAVKVDKTAKSDVDELETNNNDFLEVNLGPDNEENDAEANVSTTKSTRSAVASIIYHGRKPATKPPP